MAGQIWASSTLGGYFYSLRLSKELREAVQPKLKFVQFCDAKDASAQGQKKGDLFTWDVVFNVATQGASLTETNTMPETQFTVAQATGTLYEYGNSVPYSGKLEALSQFDVRRTVMNALQNDAAKTLDSAAFDQFAVSSLVVVSTASAALATYTDGAAGAANTSALYKANLTLIRDWMVERNIPYYDGDNYICIAHPTTLRSLKTDLESVSQYTSEGYTKIINGEIGRYDNVRFVEQTAIAKAAIGTWGQGKSNWAVFFGADTVMEGIATPMEMRAKIPTDYGRSKGLAWYALEGFAIVHNWGLTADPSAAQTRIVLWGSSA